VRRGHPTAHRIFGKAEAINCSSYVLTLAIKHGRELGSEQVPIVIDELLNMHRGQGLDIMWRECRTCPTQHQYVQMVRDKTGGLFRLAVRLLMSFDTKAKPVLPLVEMMGVYFQVRDDLINVAWPKYMDEKSYCEDLTEGKFSFPIIHYMHHAQDSARLLYLLGEGIVDIDVKKVVMKWVRETGSLKYTFCYLTDLKTAIDAEIEKLGGNQHLVKLLDKLHDGVQECVL
jgi:geranylgeranyl diphosphate synthase type 3